MPFEVWLLLIDRVTALGGFGESCDDTAYNWNYRPKNYVDVTFAEHQSDISPKPSYINFAFSYSRLFLECQIEKFLPAPL